MERFKTTTTLAAATATSVPMQVQQANTRSPVVELKPVRAGGVEREILVVDDDLNLCQLVENALKPFQVICANNGLVALELFRQRSPDLVITDLVMPGMTGFQLIQELSKYGNVPIIAMSGYDVDHKSYDHYILQEFSQSFLPKPFQLFDLTSLVEESLR